MAIFSKFFFQTQLCIILLWSENSRFSERTRYLGHLPQYIMSSFLSLDHFAKCD